MADPNDSKLLCLPWRYHSLGNCIFGTRPERNGGEMKIADVRGWGFLTGLGSQAMNENDAIKVQERWGRILAAAPEALALLREHHEHGGKVRENWYIDVAELLRTVGDGGK